MEREWCQVNMSRFVFHQGENDKPHQMPQDKSHKIKFIHSSVVHVMGWKALDRKEMGSEETEYKVTDYR